MQAIVKLWGKDIGVIALRDDDDVASFQFSRNAISNGYDISPLTMPLSSRVYRFPALQYETFKGLPGVFADSLPDRFGNAVINSWLIRHNRTNNPLSPVERLLYTGERGMGALEYAPPLFKSGTKSELLQVNELVRLASEILQERKGMRTELSEDEQDLLKIVKVGTSAGGARAKALIAWNPNTNEVRSGQVTAPKGFEYCLMKFDGISGNGDHNFLDPKGYTNIEYAYYLLAKKAGITISDCYLFKENGRSHFVTKRFDRLSDGRKLHMISLGGLCHYDFNSPGTVGYEDAAKAIEELHLSYDTKKELYRRMVFNIVFRNQDDHVKNIAFLMDENKKWKLAPAYDLTFSFKRGNKWLDSHQMTVNGKRDAFSIEDLKQTAESMGLKQSDYKELIQEVNEAKTCWFDYADKAGVEEKRASLINQEFINI